MPGIGVAHDTTATIEAADSGVVILAVKPDMLSEVCLSFVRKLHKSFTASGCQK